MSDYCIVLVPQDPRHIPSIENQSMATEALRAIAGTAGSISVETHDRVVLFDCGENLEKISCPNCSLELPDGWWGEQMDKDFDGQGFRLNSYALPCCGKMAAVNELTYDWQMAFGRFCLIAENPGIGGYDQSR